MLWICKLLLVFIFLCSWLGEAAELACPSYDEQIGLRCDYPCSTDIDCVNGGRCCLMHCGKSCSWAEVQDFVSATVRGKCVKVKTASIGERGVSLTCELRLNGSRFSDITWYKDKTQLPQGRGYVHSQVKCLVTSCRRLETSLVFESIRPQDEGMYTMAVTAGGKSYGHAVTLRLFNKPNIEIIPSQSTVRSGDDIDLTCRIINLDTVNSYFRTGPKLKWCHRGLSNADYKGVQSYGNGKETLRLEDISGDVVIGCGLSNTECTVTAEIKVHPNGDNGCPVSVDIRKYEWPWTAAGQSKVAPCPRHYSGRATRDCSSVSTWFYPNYYKCVSDRISNINRQVTRMRAGARRPQERVSPSILQLDRAASELSLTSGDIDSIVSSLSDVIILVRVYKERCGEEETQALLSVLDRTLAEKNVGEWSVILRKSLDKSTVGTLLESVKRYGQLQADEAEPDDDPVSLIKETILFGAGKNTPNDLELPPRHKQALGSRRQRRSTVDFSSVIVDRSALLNITTGQDRPMVKWTYAVYKTLSDILNSKHFGTGSETAPSNNRVRVLSDVVSVSLDSADDVEVNPPIQLTMALTHPEKMQQYMAEARRVTCGRFVPVDRTFKWSDEGCDITLTNYSVLCECKKLGHLAVIAWMPDEATSLVMLILKVCCVLPVLGALLIIALNIKRHCGDVASSLAISLSVAIVLTFVVFGAGIDWTNNQALCSIVAVFLQYMFIVIPLSVLAQSLHQVISASSSQETQCNDRPCLSLIAAVWLSAAGVVGVTAGLFGLDGYGDVSLCWVNSFTNAAYIHLACCGTALLVHSCVSVFYIYSNYGGSRRRGASSRASTSVGKLRNEFPTRSMKQRSRHCSSILKQTLRSVYLTLFLVSEAMLMMIMMRMDVTNNLLEYAFVVIVVIKTIVLIYNEAVSR